MKKHSLAKALKVADKMVTKYREKLQESGTELKDLVALEATICHQLVEERPVRTTSQQISAYIAYMYP